MRARNRARRDDDTTGNRRVRTAPGATWFVDRVADGTRHLWRVQQQPALTSHTRAPRREESAITALFATACSLAIQFAVGMVDRDKSTATFSEQEQRQFMAAALEESRMALPGCLPNPPVGCVILRGGEVVARGYTGSPGTPHAEAAALLALGPDADGDGLTMFVTLEPCAFVGRTPSCARALVRSGIRTVFVGTLDPDPRNNGAGIEIMRAAGIDVHVGVLESTVLRFLAPYLLSAQRT